MTNKQMPSFWALSLNMTFHFIYKLKKITKYLNKKILILKQSNQRDVLYFLAWTLKFLKTLKTTIDIKTTDMMIHRYQCQNIDKNHHFILKF